MKRLYYILFCLLFFCQLRGQQATLIIIPEKENKEISYQFSDSEHLPFYTLFQTKQAEPDGVFHISLPVQQPVVLNLLTEDRLSFRVYLNACKKYKKQKSIATAFPIPSIMNFTRSIH